MRSLIKNGTSREKRPIFQPSYKKRLPTELLRGFPGGASGKEPACQCRRHKRRGFNPWVGKIPWRRAWQPTRAFLPGESHGQRSLVGYSPWGCKKLDTTEVTEHGAWHRQSRGCCPLPGPGGEPPSQLFTQSVRGPKREVTA